MENILDHVEDVESEILKWTKLDKVAIKMAIGSFAIGTLLLLAFLFNQDNSIALIGLYYVIAAVFVNAMMLLTLIINCFKEPTQKHSHLKAAGILIINIPITILYISIVFSTPF